MKTASKINQGPGDPEWERWSFERVCDVLDRINFSTATAFVIAVRDEVFNTPGNRLDKDADIRYVAEKLHREGRLPLHQDILNALDAAWGASLYERCKAYDSEIIQEATDANLYPDSRSYLEIIERRGASEGWTLNAEGIRRQKENQHAQHRQRLIDTIAAGRSTYPVWEKQHGQFRYYQVADLQNESDEMLSALATRVPEWRAQLGGYAAPKDTKPQTNESLTLTVPAQNTFAVADGEFLAHPEHPEREYTRKELVNLSPEKMRELQFFPNGQSRGTARQNAITRILSNI